MGVFGQMSNAMGITGKAALDMAENVTGLTGDVASFYNLSKQILRILETLDLDIQLDGKSLKKYVVDKINEHTKATGKCEIIT